MAQRRFGIPWCFSAIRRQGVSPAASYQVRCPAVRFSGENMIRVVRFWARRYAYESEYDGGCIAMLGWIHFGTHYIATFIDFWQLRPRRFLLFKEETPTRYMPPAQFWVASLSLIFLLDLAAYSFENYERAISVFYGNVTHYGMAVRGIVHSIGMLLISSFFYFLASRLWPVRGRPRITRILEMQFYLIAIRLPATGLFILIAPWWNVFHTIDGDPTDAGYAWYGLLATYFVLTWLFWSCPYIAVLNGVSTVRAAAGMALWAVVFYPVVLLIAVVVIYFLS